MEMEMTSPNKKVLISMKEEICNNLSNLTERLTFQEAFNQKLVLLRDYQADEIRKKMFQWMLNGANAYVVDQRLSNQIQTLSDFIGRNTDPKTSAEYIYFQVGVRKDLKCYTDIKEFYAALTLCYIAMSGEVLAKGLDWLHRYEQCGKHWLDERMSISQISMSAAYAATALEYLSNAFTSGQEYEGYLLQMGKFAKIKADKLLEFMG